FNDLKNDRILDILFDWDEILDFEGESGPYLMYTHARLRSIMRKSGQAPLLDPTMIVDDEALAVARHLLLFEHVIDQVVETNKPHTLARWLLDMASLINSYYQKHRVIQEDKMLEQARLALIERVADRLKLGLELLGLWAPSEM
ncbi:TPA: arginine--tRNA ligase, partial [Candidatus Woesearchaeota archaeon]|nr:arginine--tRNA ligase [Candidatus Woesearchaeota archaeon]